MPKGHLEAVISGHAVVDISFPANMDALDPGGEWLRIAAHYRQLTDGELLALGHQQSELTDFAQQALAHELQNRGLTVESEVKEEPPPIPEMPPPDPTYEEDRKLYTIRQVWSVGDALKLQWILDRAGIPFFMGKEKATGVDAVTSNFAEGVNVQVMAIGYPWAAQALKNYYPEDKPREDPQEEQEAVPVRCPSCHSEEVVFERLVLKEASQNRQFADKENDDTSTGDSADGPSSPAETSASIYKWTCDSCGHQWEDDGVAKKE